MGWDFFTHLLVVRASGGSASKAPVAVRFEVFSKGAPPFVLVAGGLVLSSWLVALGGRTGQVVPFGGSPVWS